MQTITARNVNRAFDEGLNYLAEHGVRESSRAGDVLVAPWPVVTVYARPQERVLFNEARDANPFFHLFESLWMLAGRDDVDFLNRFVGDFGLRFAEDDGHLHGAYGHRWRNAFDGDQLLAVVNVLRKDPFTRRAVMAMWSPEMDLGASSRDIPCNTHVYFRIRPDANELDVTVCCRSNDVVWGAYGANAVHFSMLQEYVAGAVGVDVGTMYQVSNNWHGYVDVFGKQRLSRDRRDGDLYSAGEVRFSPVGDDWTRWLTDLEKFLEWAEGEDPEQEPCTYPSNPWFHETAEPMFAAHLQYKHGDLEHAIETTDMIRATDWRLAAKRWLERRLIKRAAKKEK